MKRLCFTCMVLVWVINSFGQSKALNIAGIHQLVDYSKSENRLQNTARNHQTIASAGEDYNRTLMGKLKIKYRELQLRYQVLGVLLEAVNIGVHATPLMSRIIATQTEIYRIAADNPVHLALAYQTESEFVNRARSLGNYLLGLSISLGAVNQMRTSDRKILFDHILLQLSMIQDISNNLLSTMQNSMAAGAMRTINPFQDFIDQDKAIVTEIISGARYLKN